MEAPAVRVSVAQPCLSLVAVPILRVIPWFVPSNRVELRTACHAVLFAREAVRQTSRHRARHCLALFGASQTSQRGREMPQTS